MPATLYITIDTEPDCDTHWNRVRPLTFSSVIEGIPRLLRPIWDKHHVNPIYFVCPEVVMNDACCEILRAEITKGAIIGAHLHSEYIGPNISLAANESIPSSEFPCFAHEDRVEFEKIKHLTTMIKERIGVQPVWYRAARYGADLSTIQSLEKLGYRFDSSVTPEIDWSESGGPDHHKAPEQPYYISKTDLYKGNNKQEGILEVPITIHGRRFGWIGRFLPESWMFYNWLRPTHMSVFEQKKLIDYFFEQYKNPTLVMMFHSQEVMVNKSPYVRSTWMQKLYLSRLNRTIAYFIKVQNKRNLIVNG